ncbi:MAG: hypothetical protein IKS90_03685 [Clostridia bacterium]|nr:hypothetical protein [Clostridia bacterium]
MRRALSIIGIILAAAGFVLLCLSWIIPSIKVIIPIAMFIGALIVLFIVKRMADDGDQGEGTVSLPNAAFKDDTDGGDK